MRRIDASGRQLSDHLIRARNQRYDRVLGERFMIGGN
jgi:hypothetical protein